MLASSTKATRAPGTHDIVVEAIEVDEFAEQI